MAIYTYHIQKYKGEWSLIERRYWEHQRTHTFGLIYQNKLKRHVKTVAKDIPEFQFTEKPFVITAESKWA